MRHTASASPRHFGSFGGISLFLSQIKRYASNIRHLSQLSRSLPALTKAQVSPNLSLKRTQPALPSALSHHFAISAPLTVSVQAGPLSFIR